ncbi:MAG: MarR family transcriptional regulator [Paracoccaceae bacterium]
MSAPDHTLRGFLGYGMKRAFSAIKADVDAVLAPFGLRLLTFSVLVVIRDNPGLRQTQLAEVLMIERPNLVLILDELEGADLVTRSRARDDRRAFELKVTLKGRRLFDKAVQAVEEHDRRMTMGMTDEAIAALRDALLLVETNGRTADERRKISHP